MMTKRQRQRKRHGLAPTTGPVACLRSTRIRLVCAGCGGRTPVMHSPLRLAGVWCASCCPYCNPPVAGNPAQVEYLGRQA
jgi:hypothetical protein